MNGKRLPTPWGNHGLMALCAVRYCLGRRTYITSECADTSTGSRKAASIATAQSCARLIRGDAIGGHV